MKKTKNKNNMAEWIIRHDVATVAIKPIRSPNPNLPERLIRKCPNRPINLIDFATISMRNTINCDAIFYTWKRERENKRSRKEKWMPYLAELLSWRQLFEWMTRKTFRARKQYNLCTHFVCRRFFWSMSIEMSGLLFLESTHLCEVSFWSQFSLFARTN